MGSSHRRRLIRKNRYVIDKLGGKQAVEFNSGLSISIEHETTLIKIGSSNLQLIYGGYEGQIVSIYSKADGLTVSKNTGDNGIVLASPSDSFITLNKNKVIQLQKINTNWYQI